MLIGFVSAGLMAFRQTLGVILGADIGTTLTVQLIAFRVTDYSLLLVGVGFAITFIARRNTPKDVGQAILGLGLVFLGLKLILDGAATLKSNTLALELLQVATDTPIIAVLAAAFFSALVDLVGGHHRPGPGHGRSGADHAARRRGHRGRGQHRHLRHGAGLVDRRHRRGQAGGRRPHRVQAARAPPCCSRSSAPSRGWWR